MIEILLCEVLQMDRLLDQAGVVCVKSRPVREALYVPVLDLPAVFETENLARTLQGELTFADQEQQ